jgi:hypothetical protein
MKRPEFTATEMFMLPSLPGALEALADYHSYQETCAEASDFMAAAEFHKRRSKELLDTATFIRTAWENGEDVKFDGEENVPR